MRPPPDSPPGTSKTRSCGADLRIAPPRATPYESVRQHRRAIYATAFDAATIEAYDALAVGDKVERPQTVQHPRQLRRVLRKRLRRRRLAAPPDVRWALSTGALLFLLYGGALLWLLLVDPLLGAAMLRLFFVTFIAGREAAMLSAYEPPDPAPAAWVAGMAALDDMATLFVAAAALWYGIERLRDVPALDGFVRLVDGALRRHRKAFDKWGTLALAAFLWLPGIGTGPVLSVGIGILGGIPLRRLLPALSVSAVAVNLFWAYTIEGTTRLFPDQRQLVPLTWAVASVVIIFAVWGLWRHRKARYLLQFEALPERTFSDSVRLSSLGFRQNGRTFMVDSRDVAARTGLDAKRVAECHWASRLLLLPTMPPEMAGKLATAGITGRRDLVLVPTHLACLALGSSDAETAAKVEQWKIEAKEQMAVPMPDDREE